MQIEVTFQADVSDGTSSRRRGLSLACHPLIRTCSPQGGLPACFQPSPHEEIRLAIRAESRDDGVDTPEGKSHSTITWRVTF